MRAGDGSTERRQKRVSRLIFAGLALGVVISAIGGYAYNPRASWPAILLHTIIILGAIGLAGLMLTFAMLFVLGVQGKLTTEKSTHDKRNSG
jgi:hypothetical protein